MSQVSIKKSKPETTRIQEIIQRIKEGDILIPSFQRKFVWSAQQVLELLNSVYKDYPFGSVLLWNTKERLKLSRNIGGFKLPNADLEYPVNYVLDGQQRLTVLYAVMTDLREEDHTETEDDIDTSIFNVYFDLDEKTFVLANEIAENHTNIKMSSLFNVQEFHEAVSGLNKAKQAEALNLQNQFFTYQFPIITTYARDKEEVANIFERINNTGTKLTTLDLMVAWTWTDKFHLGDELISIKKFLDNAGYGDLPDKNLLQCLSGIIKEKTNTKEILTLDPEIVRKNIKKLTDSLFKTIDFFAEDLKITHLDFLPHLQLIVPVTFLFSRLNRISVKQRNILLQWFWANSFSRRYGSGTDEKMNEDIQFFKKVIINDYSGIDKYTHTVDEKILMSQKFSKGNPYTRALLVLMAQYHPKDLTNGTRISLKQALSHYNYREYHHIFPKSFLKKKGVHIAEINSLCNFCILPAASNKLISDKKPSDYMFNLVPKNKKTKILESNLIPVDDNLYKKNDYKNFLKRRASIILEKIQNEIES